MTLLLICSSSWAGTFTIRVNKDAACTMDLSNGLYLWWWSDVDGNEFVSTTLQDGWYTATIISDANTISCLAVNRNSWGGHLQTADFDNITSDICFLLTGSSSSYLLQETSCESASGPISVTDGSLSDWDNLPQEYVYSYVCPEGASYDGLLSMKAYADEKYINLAVEYNPEVITDLSWVPFHVYIDTDNSALTGGFGDQWTSAAFDVMLETAVLTEGYSYPYNPGVCWWWGAVGENGWDWYNPNVEQTSENCWGMMVCEGSLPIGNSQLVGNTFEIQLDRELIPTRDECPWGNVMNIGVDIQQSWSSVGVLPTAPYDEYGVRVKAAPLTVRVAGTSSDEDTTIPTASDLAQYEQDGYFVACINFQGEVCNDIVFVGSYNGWSTTPEEMVHFTPLNGFDGWYVAVVPVSYDEYGVEANEGKPIQLASDGTFSWDYQTGDFDSWELISGSVDIMSGYSGESNLRNWSSAEPVILKSLYFKNNNSPCGDIVTYDYTINLKAPDCGGYEPAIIGDFNNWVEGVAMAPIGDGWYQAVVNSMPGRRVNFRASTSADWSNAIQIYDSEYGAWLNIADYYLTEETTINIDYSAGKYTWCENDVPTPECYTLNVNVAEGGYVNISPEADCYEEGTQITLTAEAYEGYQFSQWSDGNTDNPRLLTMTEDIYLTAEFTYTPIEEHSYTIRVKKDDVSDMDISNGLYLYWWKTDEAGQVATMTLDGDGWYTTTVTTTATSINCLAVNVNVDNEGWIGQQTTDYTNITGDICLAIGANDAFYNSNYNLYAVPCEDMEYTLKHNFEDANTNAQWRFIQNGQTNYWTIGSAAGSADGGSNALYITSDGYNYAYEVNDATSISWAYLPVTLSNTDHITFSWKGMGESGYDYLRVYLLPEGYTPQAGNTELPEVAISLSDMLIGTYEWQHFAAMAGVEGEYNLCLMWRNDHSWGETPIAIDNVAITYPVTNLVVTTNCGKAYASWESEAPYYEVAVFNSGGERVLFGIVDVKEGVSNSQPFSDGEYTWQVTPMYSDIEGDYAGDAVQVPFTISADNCVDLGIYNLDYTINGETVNITWESEAPQYRIWMYDYNYHVFEERWIDVPNYTITLSEMGKYYFGIRGYNADATQYSDYSELDIDFVNGEIPYNLNFVYAEQYDNGLWNNAYQRPIVLYSEDYQTIMRIYPMPAYENSIVGTYLVENNDANLYAGGLYGSGSYITYRGLSIAEYMQNGMVTIARNADGQFVVSFDLTDANGNVYTNTCTIVNMYGDNIGDDYVTALSATKALELTQSLEHTNLTTMPYFVEGKISTMHNTPMQIVHYGTAIFDISEDGYENNQFKCYQAKWLNNTNFTTGEEIALGDSVVVYGHLQNYRGNTPEIQGYIYQHYSNELEETCYTLNVLTNNDNYGYVDVLPYQECYLEGEAVTLTAVPYAGCEFVEWSDGVTDAVRTINMYSDVQLTAIFRDINNPDVECYTLTLYPEQLSDGQGGYAFAAPNYDCYEPNTPVVIHAHAAPGYVFSHWSDGDTNAERTIIMTQNLEYTAYFEQELGCYQLNVTSTDGGHVDVTPATQGCYEEGTIVTLAAVADEGFEFVQWNDGNKDATRVVVMNSDCNFHATFTRTATKYDIQNLAVTSSNLRITAKWSSLATRFEITITNNKNEVVNSEKVDISEDNKVYRYTAPKYTTYTITVKPLDAADNQIGIEASKSITLERKYSLNIYTEYGGTVNEEVNGEYTAGTSVEIIATPNNGYRFLEWSDGDQNAKRTLIMDQDYDLMATFKRIPTYTLEVFEGENGLANIPAGSYTYQENEVVQLTPIPNDGYLFDHWVVNGVNDTNETITLTMTQNYSVYPVCVAIPIPTYTLTILPGEFGKANMAVGTYTYNEGEKVTLLPVADADYLFDQWVVNGEAMTDSVLVLDMVKDYEVMPTFVPNQVAVENIYDGVTIMVEQRTITVLATQSQDIALYDLVGHLIEQCPHTRVATFTVPSAGLYLVCTASGVKKIHVE